MRYIDVHEVVVRDPVRQPSAAGTNVAEPVFQAPAGIKRQRKRLWARRFALEPFFCPRVVHAHETACVCVRVCACVHLQVQVQVQVQVHVHVLACFSFVCVFACVCGGGWRGSTRAAKVENQGGAILVK